VLVTLFHHNGWANRKLLEFCEALSDEQLDSTATGGFGSIRETLRHIISSEVSYVTRVNDKQFSTPIPRESFPGFALLKDAAQWASDELLELALSARKETLVRQRPPRDAYEYPLTGLMMQALTHSTEHRAQVATIITQLDLQPPDMSGWEYMDAMGEIQEFTRE
jgi:uncharacterized damage-inducible protein DinB